MLLLELKHSYLFGKQQNQSLEFNLELYVLVMVLVNLKKRHLFTVCSRYVGLIHDLSICEQGYETKLKVDHYDFYHISSLP